MTTPSTSLTIQEPEARKKPMEMANFERIETNVEKTFRLTPRMRDANIPKRDAEGNIYGWEYTRVLDGFEVEQLQPPPIGLIDALRRPAAPGYAILHLTRIETHLKHTRGPAAFAIICEDIDRDLTGISEWAVVKACETFRKAGKPWFPDTPEFETEARKWDDVAKRIAGHKPPIEPRRMPNGRREPAPEKTPEMKAHVNQLLHDGGFHNIASEMAEVCPMCAEIVKNRKNENHSA